MARKTTAKTTAAKAKTAKAASTPKTAPQAEPKVIKKPDLLDQVVGRTNLKKRDVKPAVEAAFALIADALRDGAEVNVPPLGKVRVVKSKDIGDGAAVLTLKLRTPKNASAAASDAKE